MRIMWDCRSVSEHMGGIGVANTGWLRETLNRKPPHWDIISLFSETCRPDTVRRLLPALPTANIRVASAGMVARVFEQVTLPSVLEREQIDLYFNPCFSIPAIKTTRYECSVVHDVVFLEHPEWVDERLCKYLVHGTDLSMRRADAVFTVSEFSRSRIYALAPQRGWGKDGSLTIIRPSIPEHHRTPSHGGTDESPLQNHTESNFILYVGAIEQKKGIKDLLDAYGCLSSRMSSTCPSLVLAGGTGGQSFDIENEVNVRGLRDRVHLLGWISEEHKSNLLRQARIFVFPSLYEGFGIPPLEAMAAGTPVIAAHTSSLPEVLGDAAVFTEPGDVEGLAEAIHNVLEDKELRETMLTKGRLQVAKYDWGRSASTIISCFQGLEASA